MLGHSVRIMLGYVLELIHKLASVHHLDLPLHLTNHIYKLVEYQQRTIAFLGTLHHLMSYRSRYILIVIPVGKFIGVITFVIALCIISAIGLHSAIDPLSPNANTL